MQLKIDWQITRRDTATEEHYVKDENGWPVLIATVHGFWAVHSLNHKKNYEGTAANLKAAKQAVADCCHKHSIRVLAVVV